MSLLLNYTPYTLKFNFDAGTSRGVLKEKLVWFIKVHNETDPRNFGLGEISTIDRLSFDFNADFEHELGKLADNIRGIDIPESAQDVYVLVQQLVPSHLPSIRFALETALLDYMNGGKRQIFKNNFYWSHENILINGLVWMGDKSFMKDQIDRKFQDGFSCIKLKIGAIDFDEELALLEYIRGKYTKEQLALRVDANGAFTTQECMLKLKALEAFDLHSIEQPIMPRQPEAMSLLCLKSKVPIALDEDLIGVYEEHQKKRLLDEIDPAYIVIKPSLVGGFASAIEWINLAEERGIGWWITSALESNIGLNAISQFTAEQDAMGHQGLGTGQLFENNIPSPLRIQGEFLSYKQNAQWDFTRLEF